MWTEVRDFFYRPKHIYYLWSPSSLLLIGYWEPLLGGEMAEVPPQSPFKSKVKNEKHLCKFRY
jgi:hypothetical protein